MLDAAKKLFAARDFPSNEARATAMVRAACDLHSPAAWRYNAMLATLGLGQPQDFDVALKSLSRAAALGDVASSSQLRLLTASGKFEAATWFAPSPTEQHCDSPRLYTIKRFLEPAVCDWLIASARPRLQQTKIKVADGARVVDPVRNNDGAGFWALESDVVFQLARLRISAALGLPLAHQESTNVLRYCQGQEYKRHYDFITPDEEGGFAEELKVAGQRVVTLLVYLNDSYEGGETDFPRLNWRFKGKAGDALVFWNLSATGQREPFSLHAGLPVVRGEKWLLSQWVRERPVPLGKW